MSETAQILYPDNKAEYQGPRIAWPVFEFPAFRTTLAQENKCADNILIVSWGGIGDQICAEPTMRYMIDRFRDVKISLATDYPEVFQHLKFSEVFNTKVERPDVDKYLLMRTIADPEELSWQFISHCVTHCVDYPSICAIRSQLPIDYRTVKLEPTAPTDERLLEIVENAEKYVVIHAGKHWQSKTFPVQWWNDVLESVVEKGFIPVLIGKTVDHNVGFVDCNHEKAIDLRDQCPLNDTVWLSKHCKYVICSDSSPLHMAVTGNAHIAFVATAKHQDYITHWRKNLEGKTEWAWRMKHFNKGGIWDLMDHCPNKEEQTTVEFCDPDVLASWLPEPKEMIEWLSQQK